MACDPMQKFLNSNLKKCAYRVANLKNVFLTLQAHIFVNFYLKASKLKSNVQNILNFQRSGECAQLSTDLSALSVAKDKVILFSKKS